MSISTRIVVMAAGILGVCSIAIIAIVLGIRGSTKEIETQVVLMDKQATLLAGQEESVAEQFQAIQEQVVALENQEQLDRAVESFVEMRYWLVDLSLSWLNSSEASAEEAHDQLELRLQELEQGGVDLGPSLRPKIALCNSLMLESVDAYIDGNRVLGNSLVSKARQHADDVGQELSALLLDAQSQAADARSLVSARAEDVNAATTGVREAADEVRTTGQAVMDRNSFAFISSFIALIVAGCISAFLAWIIRKSIVDPLQEAVDVIEGFGGGDLTRKIDESREDEIGRMGRAFNSATHGIQTALETEIVDWDQLAQDQAAMARLMAIVEQAPVNLLQADEEFNIVFQNQASEKRVADLQNTMRISPGAVLGSSIDIFLEDAPKVRAVLRDPSNLPHIEQVQIGEEFLELQFSAIREADGTYSGPSMAWKVLTQERELEERLKSTVLDLISCADEMRASSGELLRVSNDTSRVAEETMLETKEVNEGAASVSLATEEMSGSVADVADSSRELAESASRAVAAAGVASDLVASLQEANEQISRMSETISAIADQTNLLALNANIEAASAGEAGRGFSVVASEVKQLARGTMQATETINQHVVDINGRSENVAKAIAEIGVVIQSVDGLIATLSSSVDSQGVTTSEISEATALNVERAKKISERMDEVTQAADISTRTAQNVMEAADQLRTLAHNLHTEE